MSQILTSFNMGVRCLISNDSDINVSILALCSAETSWRLSEVLGLWDCWLRHEDFLWRPFVSLLWDMRTLYETSGSSFRGMRTLAKFSCHYRENINISKIIKIVITISQKKNQWKFPSPDSLLFFILDLSTY